MSNLKKLNCILLIDDDKHNNFINQIIIRKTGIKVLVKLFLNAKEALEFLNGSSSEMHLQPGIIFLDLNMPVMNGWEFMDQYDKLSDEIKLNMKVILLTSSIDKQDEERAGKNKNIYRFMSKPLTTELLISIINEHFETV